MNRAHTRALTTALIASLCTIVGTATAQDALGTGNALDASPSTRGRLNTQRPSFADELRFRNAIATGNAPGGLSFRGDLGYRAAGEFSGALGSDSLFAFRRDSLYSGLAGMGIRGTEAVQYQFALTTGARPPRDLMGNLAVSREFGYSADPRTGIPTQPIAINNETRMADPAGRALSAYAPERDDGSMLGTLRSSSSYLSTAGLQPMLLTIYGQGIEQTPYGVTASNLRGVTIAPLHSNTLIFQNKNEESESTGLVRTSISDLAQKQVDRAIEMLKNHDEESNANTDASQSAGEGWFSQRMAEIRAELYGTNDDATDQSTTDKPDDADENEDPSNLSSTGVNIPDPLDRDMDLETKLREFDKRYTETDPAAKKDPLELSPEMLEILRGDSMPVNNFINRDVSSDDVYADHIRTGERLIAAERYFDAEERFTRALAIRPGDVTSQIGRIHAQIGAGMVLSGAVNLQAIITDFPQLASTRYSEKLLPSPVRTKELIEGLRLRAGIALVNGETLHDDQRVRLSSALLLAYLGYQTLDADAVSDGLGVMAEIGSPSDQRLARLLEQIWDVSLEMMDKPSTTTDQSPPAGADAEE